MSVLGIIVEYNPFHNGHKYHIEQSKKLSGADSVICVMSGNFIQRGEPAIVDKWSRAEMALKSGVDLVIELPVVYAMSSAEYFAFGAVKLLDSLGIVDCISFGSEAGRIEELNLIAGILSNEPEEYKLLLKNHLSEGLSFPAARERALDEYLVGTGHHWNSGAGIIKSSNNILGIEYMKALNKLNSKIKKLTIERVANTYNSQELQGAISSATAIRKHILASKAAADISKSGDVLSRALPTHSLEILHREFEAGRGPVFPGDFEKIILSALRCLSIKEIARLPYVAEGLENRIKDLAGESGTLDELIENICTRRYTRTRVQRCLFNLLTGIGNEEFEKFNLYGGPQYIRVLGFNQTGRRLLSEINKTAALPVIIKTADFKDACNPLLSRMLQIEAASTDQYVLAYKNPESRHSGQEFTRNLVICQP